MSFSLLYPALLLIYSQENKTTQQMSIVFSPPTLRRFSPFVIKFYRIRVPDFPFQTQGIILFAHSQNRRSFFIVAHRTAADSRSDNHRVWFEDIQKRDIIGKQSSKLEKEIFSFSSVDIFSMSLLLHVAVHCCYQKEHLVNRPAETLLY